MRTERRITGMRLRKRLSAAILAIVLMVSSIQIPGGISYAAEIAGDSITSEQAASTLTAEEKESAGMAELGEGAITDGGNLADDEEAASGDDYLARDDSQTDDDNPTGDDSQPENDDLAGGDSKTGDDDPAGDDSQTEDENDSEETDADQVSGNDLVKPELSVLTKKSVAEEGRIVEAEIEGAYQFGDAPSGNGSITAFSVSAYDDSAEEYVYQQMLGREYIISFGEYSVSEKDIESLVSSVLNEHPDLYFVNRDYSYSLSYQSDLVALLCPTYDTSYDDAAFKENTDAALACVNDGMSDLEKAAALHDWLAVNVEYDYGNYLANTVPEASYNAYGALVDGIAVCNGYALAYKYLLNQIGIECYMVNSESMNHAWNMVKLDGEYYHVDVTWDDPTWDMVGVAYHANLFRSDANFGAHKEWVVTSGSNTVNYEATDTKYEEAFWVDYHSPLVFYGSDCYYVNKGKVKKGDFSSITDDTGTEIADIGMHWKIWVGNTGWDINGATYSGLYMINDRLFYNDWDSIYSIKPDGTDKKTEFTPEKEDRNQIYYSAYRRGKVVYALQSSSDTSNVHGSKQNVLIAEITGIGGTENPEPPETEDYTISYELDGGTNDPGNPVKYNSGMETIILKAAAKDGFVFGGWYKDAEFKEKITRIPQGSTGDITLYAKWNEGLNAPNLSYTFEALDGTKVSSVADGKPKVLLFYRVSEGPSQRANQEFSEHIKAFSGVDIYAIAVSADKDKVSTFKSEYGCDEITYCYDTVTVSSGKANYDNPTRMVRYVQLMDPTATSSTAPVIVYIDAENRVQHVVKGTREWTGIFDDLREYCGYDGYWINYELDGGKNNSENPYVYTEDTETIVLKDPTNGANQFDGWYTDPEFAQEQKVTEIPKGSSGDITLYAKWGKTGSMLGLDNLDKTFKAVDDTTFSSAAENGRPRILIFFSANCLNSAYTMENIKNAKEELDGVDICKIECVGASKDDVTIIQEGCEFEKNTVSYDTGSGNANAMLAYLAAAQITETPREFPVICYIDSNNYLQWVTMDRRAATADDIKANLKKYCNYPPEPEGVYHITYELDGGTNHEDNPDTYTAETEDIVLKDASKARFIFEGWYKDAEFKEQVKTIPKGSTGDITLYAKWREKEDSGLDIDNLNQTYTGLDGKKLSSAADGKPKLLVFFAASYTRCQNTVKNISEIIDSLDGVDIYAVEILKASKSDVTAFQNTYGCDRIKFAYNSNSYQFLDAAEDYKKAAGLSGTMNPPLICYIDKDNKLQWATMGETQTGEEVLENLKKYCNYPSQGQEIYHITYVLDCGTNRSSNPTTYTSETETIILEDAFKKGYIFEGWYSDAEFNEQVTQIAQGSTGDITLYAKWGLAEFIVSIKRPDRTTYKVGEELDVTGGKVILTDRTDESIKEEKDMELSMLEGFDSSEPGICTVMVVCDGYTCSFEALIVDEPEVTVKSGQKLGSAYLPTSEYGTYAWADDVDLEKELIEAGIYAYGAVFTPNDTEKFQTLTDLQIQVRVAKALNNNCVRMEFLDGPYTYRGEQIKPKVKVMYIDGEGEEVTLIEGQDYELDYDDNLTEYGIVHVTGVNDYTGTVSEVFDIGPAKRTIRALDKVILVGSEIPTEFEYEIVGGLYEGDELLVPPRFECDITSTAEEGEYDIRVSGASTGSLIYVFRYEKGTLYVVSEAATCKVTFNVQGHGTAPKDYVGIRTGDTIDRPEDPAAEGYRFDGWYKDTACTKAWDFGTDTVQSDVTLYAKWLGIYEDGDGEFAVQEIADVYYNGKAQKPAVSVYDENMLLKAGKDYTIKYYNNINANKDGVLKGEEFNQALPYVEITGKGNYKETVRINFNILRASIGDDFNPAAGVTLKVNDQLVKANKPQKTFGSLKYGRNLKEGTDYELELRSVIASDGSGKPVSETKPYSDAKVPANYTGEFWLMVKGKGNYTGSISRTVYVADKAHLMKNVKITLGKDLKNITYTDSGIELKAAEKLKPADDEFVVTYGSTVLKPDVDYYAYYNKKAGVGKAELVVTGMNGYVGKKTATFNIKGKAFTNGTVEVTELEDQAYTGRAVVQNKNAVLTWKADGTELVYGTDYTISYSKNVDKGTATMTFTGIAEAGYSGKISKKFKITAADIADVNKVTRAESMNAITLPYTKAGVKPVDEIILTNERGTRLQVGKDYTLAYKNNKAVANATAEKAPTVTVKGKGNYSGSFDVKFTIERADLRGGNITIECAQVPYNSNKPDTYEYKPAVTVKDDKTKLKADVDYEISYVRNTQADFKGYWESLVAGLPTTDEIRLVAVIKEKEGSAYTLQGDIEVPLQIYTEKLTKNNLEVKIDPAVYTGGQVRPKVTVAYKGENGNIPLEEGVDYTLVYGANTASGKNKGSVTIKGLAPKYGGSVAYKFEIIKKDLKYWFFPIINEK